MFYQYLRGRQYELLALRATAATIAKAGNVVPVVEPVVRQLRAVERAAEALFDAGAPLILITNPAAPKSDWEGIEDILDDDAFPAGVRDNLLLIPAHIVLSSASSGSVGAFLKRHATRPVAIVHQERCPDSKEVADVAATHGATVTHLFVDGSTPKSHRDLFPKKQRGLIRDGFTRQDKNALYPEDEFFSDLYATFRADGYAGFGDYSIVGDYFSLGGGNPRAVAIHLTYHRPDEKAIYCRHFVSDSNDTTSDPGAKFMEAARKAARFLRTNPEVKTAGTVELLEYYKAKHFPGLAKLKELSMRHHIELVSSLI